ncbi:MAG: hypothetical protein K2N35_05460 [Muribaculaceae bacterium]|nr:hypothetical protein [Muribaculaceae bacterium]
MNKKIFLAIAAFMLPMMAPAQTNTELLHITDLTVNKGDSLITFNMNVNPKAYKVKSNDIVTLTPRYVLNDSTFDLPPVRIAGRKAWFTSVRDGNATPLTLSRAGQGDPIEYSSTVGYDPLAGAASIIIKADTTSVCNCDTAKSGLFNIVEITPDPFTNILDFVHNFTYIAPKDTADKVFDLAGRANIIFKVNDTAIDWKYLSNKAELDTIMKTVNAVRDNEYATVDTIHLTGYASPEGPYSNNVRLAKGRTEVVKNYVEERSTFPHSIYGTSSVPEDWGGLREYIVNSSFANKDAMIAFIDDPSIPKEKRNDIFRAKFPTDYPYLLENVYPLLRHTDYMIRYRIKKFYDVEEIAKVFQENAKLLSLNELYLLSNKYEPGSQDYYQVFLTAAVLFPESEVANLNAAGCAMSVDDFQTARMYLEKVKPGPESYYAWGVLYAMEKNYDESLEMLKKARDAGSEKAAEMIPAVQQCKDAPNQIVIY